MKKLILVAPFAVGALVIVSISLLITGCFFSGLIAFVGALILNEYSETFAYKGIYETKEDPDFKILTFNVNRAYKFSKNKGNSHDLLHIILQHDPDVILLQEFNSNLYPEVQEQLTKTYPYGSCLESTSRFKSVFSKFPVESSEQLMVDTNDPQYELFQNAIYCRKSNNGMEILPICKMIIRIGARRLQVFNCHLMSNNYSVVIRNLKTKERSLFYSLGAIFHRMNFGYKARELQTKVIGLHIDSSIPTLICGDFNDVCGSSPLRIMQSLGLSDAWWNRGLGYGSTYHGYGFRFRLDHIFYSPASLNPICIKVPYTNTSDHCPIVCDFKIVNK